VSTGLHLYLYLGWLEMHRYGRVWTVEHFHFAGLFAVLLNGLTIHRSDPAARRGCNSPGSRAGSLSLGLARGMLGSTV
jgi:hypothetical protein